MKTEVITVTPSTPLVEFARILAEDRISGAPVVRVDGVLVGIVSKTDLVERMLQDNPKYGTAQSDGPGWNEDWRQVDDIMSNEILTVAPSTPLADVARRMARDRVHRVVVIENDKIVGIVTSLDLLERYRG